MIRIKRATIENIPAITDIYNEAIRNSVATFDTQEKSYEMQKKWFLDHDRLPIFVAKKEGMVLGWASLSTWSDRCAYSGTAEISTYIERQYRNAGIGTKLKMAIIEEGAKAGVQVIISRVAGDNEESIALNKKLGFKFIGTMHKVGMKFGQFHDVHLFEYIY